MATVQCATLKITFESKNTKNGSITESGKYKFPSTVQTAEVALQSWDISYDEKGKDNRLLRIGAGVEVKNINGSEVDIEAIITLYDDDQDENIEGEIVALLIAILDD